MTRYHTTWSRLANVDESDQVMVDVPILLHVSDTGTVLSCHEVAPFKADGTQDYGDWLKENGFEPNLG